MLNKGNNRAVLGAVDAADPQPGESVADFGFGGGVGLRPLLDRVGPTGRVHGVEIADTMLDLARRRFAAEIGDGRLQLHSGDLTALPLADASLDAAITTNTIYFIENLPRAFSEVARVLRPGGRFVVGIGDPKQMGKLPFTAHGFRLRPVDEVAELLRAAGFAEPTRLRVGDSDGAFHLLLAERDGQDQ